MLQTWVAPSVCGLLMLCAFLALVNEPQPEPSSSVAVRNRVRVLIVATLAWFCGLFGLLVLALRALGV